MNIEKGTMLKDFRDSNLYEVIKIQELRSGNHFYTVKCIETQRHYTIYSDESLKRDFEVIK